MSKFDYEVFHGEDKTYIGFNAKKYTPEQALKIGAYELDIDQDTLCVEEAWVRYGFYTDSNDERANGYYLEFEPIRNCLKAYAVSRKSA
jgi:hypothetical protein